MPTWGGAGKWCVFQRVTIGSLGTQREREQENYAITWWVWDMAGVQMSILAMSCGCPGICYVYRQAGLGHCVEVLEHGRCVNRCARAATS